MLTNLYQLGSVLCQRMVCSVRERDRPRSNGSNLVPHDAHDVTSRESNLVDVYTLSPGPILTSAHGYLYKKNDSGGLALLGGK